MKRFSELYRRGQNVLHGTITLELIALTGMRVNQLDGIAFDLDLRYAQTTDGQLILLPSHLIKTLQKHPPIPTAQEAQTALTQIGTDEAELHEYLATALWKSSEDGRIILDVISTQAVVLPLEFTYPFSILPRLDPADQQAFEQAHLTLDFAVRTLLHVDDGGGLLGKLLEGRFIFLVVSTGVSGINLIHNLVMGRLLSPAEYGQLTFFITLNLIVGLLPSAIQTVSAKFGAMYSARLQTDEQDKLYRYATRYSWVVGLVIALVVGGLAPYLTTAFRIQSVMLFVPIALALPFFVATGIDRGTLQGKESYYWLAGAYLAEGIVRFVVSVILGWLLLSTGRALDGAVWALGQSLLATWFVAWLPLRQHRQTHTLPSPNRAQQDEWMSLLGFVALALVGQALITNSDFLLVKSFFGAVESGLYAAVSVMGRIIYFSTLPLTILMVPLIARQHALGKPTRLLFVATIGLGAVLCSTLIIIASLFARPLISLLYGEAYVEGASILPLYTIAASLFVMTNLIVTFRVSLGEGKESWMPLVAGLLQVGGIILFHETLLQVVWVQIAVMSVLLAGVLWRSTR
ncbi:MAG: hypothetical protein ACOYLB_16695 [Phototrophicaceae bacterium]